MAHTADGLLPATASTHESALTARPRVGTLRGVVASIAVHAAVFGGALTYTLYAPSPTPRKFLQAHLVALGAPAPKEQLPHKVTPPPAPPTRAVPMPAVVPPPMPAHPTAVSVPAPHVPEKSLSQRMAEALAQVKAPPHPSPVTAPKSAATTPTAYEAEGQRTGSVYGDVTRSEETDAYGAAILEAVKQHYVVPNVISERERMYLKTEVIFWVGADGTIVSHKISKFSGNHLFDEAVESALRKAHLPPPPTDIRDAVRKDGIEIDFNP